MCLLFFAKAVCALAMQSLRVFAPFLAEDMGLGFPEYRLGILASDLAAVAPALCALDAASPRALSSAAMLAHAASLLAPSLLPRGRAADLVLCRFVSGLAWTVLSIVAGAVLSRFPGARRTQAIALVEMSWFLASFVVPAFGVLLDGVGVPQTVTLLLVAPSLVLAWASARVLPSSLRLVADEDAAAGCCAAPPSGPDAQSVHRRMAGLLAWTTLVSLFSSAFQCRYGQWLHGSFGMSASAVGGFSNAIAVGNLAGNLVTQILGDVVLPVRTVAALMGLLMAALSVVLFAVPATISVASLFVLVLLLFLSMECSFLTSFSYATQLLGDAEMTGMSLRFASSSLGSVIGDWVAPYPSMPALFGASAVGYLVASGLLVACSPPHGGQFADADHVSERETSPTPIAADASVAASPA